MTDPYALLGVSPTATQAEIAHAYRRELRAYHPDTRSAGNSGGDDRCRQILAAYALLRDPGRRAEYDRAAKPTRADATPVRVTVARGSDTGDPPPMWAGPVRWHRRS